MWDRKIVINIKGIIKINKRKSPEKKIVFIVINKVISFVKIFRIKSEKRYKNLYFFVKINFFKMNKLNWFK